MGTFPFREGTRLFTIRAAVVPDNVDDDDDDDEAEDVEDVEEEEDKDSERMGTVNGNAAVLCFGAILARLGCTPEGRAGEIFREVVGRSSRSLMEIRLRVGGR